MGMTVLFPHERTGGEDPGSEEGKLVEARYDWDVRVLSKHMGDGAMGRSHGRKYEEWLWAWDIVYVCPAEACVAIPDTLVHA